MDTPTRGACGGERTHDRYGHGVGQMGYYSDAEITPRRTRQLSVHQCASGTKDRSVSRVGQWVGRVRVRAPSPMWTRGGTQETRGRKRKGKRRHETRGGGGRWPAGTVFQLIAATALGGDRSGEGRDAPDICA